MQPLSPDCGIHAPARRCMQGDNVCRRQGRGKSCPCTCTSRTCASANKWATSRPPCDACTSTSTSRHAPAVRVSLRVRGKGIVWTARRRPQLPQSVPLRALRPPDWDGMHLPHIAAGCLCGAPSPALASSGLGRSPLRRWVTTSDTDALGGGLTESCWADCTQGAAADETTRRAGMAWRLVRAHALGMSVAEPYASRRSRKEQSFSAAVGSSGGGGVAGCCGERLEPEGFTAAVAGRCERCGEVAMRCADRLRSSVLLLSVELREGFARQRGARALGARVHTARLKALVLIRVGRLTTSIATCDFSRAAEGARAQARIRERESEPGR